MQSFGTITLVLAMALQLAPSTNKVQLTPHARLAHPPRSLPTGCSLWMAGDHWTLRWKLFLMAAKHSSARQQRGGGQELAPPAMPMPRFAPRPGEGPTPEVRTAVGRRALELTDHRYLAGPPGPTAELGGFGAPG